MQATCRVRKLKIKTHGKAVLSRITFLLEDALRTASFPGIPPNGVVYVRRMNLGAIKADISSGFLSHKIDAFIRDLRPVHAQSSAARGGETEAVWFSDEMEPLRLLAEKLARGDRPASWYWKAAVDGFSPQASVSENMETILFRASEKAAGLTGLAWVARPLLRNGHILEQLDAMGPDRAAALLPFPVPGSESSASFRDGERDPETSRDAPRPPFPGLSERYRHLAAKAFDRWGTDDARSALIVCLGLAESGQEPSALMVRRVQKAVRMPSLLSRVYPEAISTDRNGTFPEAGSHAPRSRDGLRFDSESGQGPPPEPSEIKGERPDHMTEAGKTGRIVAGDQKPPAHGLDAEESTKAGKDESLSHTISDHSGPYAAHRRTDSPAPAKHDPSSGTAPREIRKIPPVHTREAIDRPPLPESRIGRKNRTRPERTGLYHPFAGEFTEYAGFAFLINVADRLGIEDILSGHDASAADVLANHMLRRIADWQGIPHDDPVLRFLVEEPEDAFSIFDCDPPLNRRMIHDAARIGVKELFRIPKSRNPLSPLRMNQVTHVFVIAVCRYIHRHGKISIRKLIRRPAFIALTKTHVDVTASMKRLDIRIRMAGLDINPGWVPWLKKVVQFHYTEDDF